MAKRRSDQEWHALFEQYEARELTQRAFCEQNNLSPSTFSPSDNYYSKLAPTKTAVSLKHS